MRLYFIDKDFDSGHRQLGQVAHLTSPRADRECRPFQDRARRVDDKAACTIAVGEGQPPAAAVLSGAFFAAGHNRASPHSSLDILFIHMKDFAQQFSINEKAAI